MTRGATIVVHCRQEPYDVLIDRSTEMGNPFVIGRDGTRDEVIEKYRAWAPDQPWFQDALDKVRGMRIGCWCAPRACHGDFLAEMADRTSAEGIIRYEED